MSLSTLQTELDTRVDDSINSDISARWINISRRECLNYFHGVFPFLVASKTASSVGGQQSYSLDTDFSVSDFGRPLSVKVGSNVYTRVDWQDRGDATLQDKYAVSPDMTSILLFPTPSGSGTDDIVLDYVSRPDNLVEADDDIDEVPAQWKSEFEEAIIYGAMARYYEQAEKPNLANRHKDERSNVLDSVISEITQLSPNDAVQVSAVDYNASGGDAF